MSAYDKFSASMFGCSSRAKIDFLKNEMNIFNEKLSNLSNSAMGSLKNSYGWLRDRLASTHDRLFNSSKLNEIRDYLMENGSVIQDGYLHKLNLSNYMCNTDTKEFILNHPMVFRFHRYGFLNNFNDSINIDRSVRIPEFRKDYIQTYDGIVRRVAGREFVTKYHMENPYEEVSFNEIAVRMDIWETVTKMLGDGLDPTEEKR